MGITAYVKRMLVLLALVGALAVFTGVALGIGAGHSVADAAPVRLPAGTLGIGGARIAPLAPTVSAGEVEVTALRPTAASLVATAPLAAAPIVKPVVKRPAVKRTTAKRPTARKAKKTPAPTRVAASTTGWSTARASWYGPGFYGRRTASGAVYTQTMMNVAHKSLPFGTRIEFEFNGRRCIAVVNDRGPFVAGRTFDLGAGTAKALGFGGVHMVRYRILGR